MLSVSAQKVNAWLKKTGLTLALHKCEAMIITRTRTHNDLNIVIDGYRVATRRQVKYLGVHIDSKWKFSEHARIVSEKASRIVQGLSRILPNISAAKPTKRKLLSNVVHSIMLYGCPLWADDMSTSGWATLCKVQRRICLRVVSAYCTVSGDAVRVIAGIPPLDLLAKERKDLYLERKNRNHPPTDEADDITTVWQRRWDSSEKGRWTQRLIPDIRRWINRRHGEVNFHLTQALSGHGCFAEYLRRFGKLGSAECWYCGHACDDAYHTFFACDAWYTRRGAAENLLGVTLTPENLIATMLGSKRNWEVINDFIHQIMTRKETEERRRQADA
uniref:Retrovirus-related Pol polyprotein from type-1 retrotransposable element R1 n=1 Tax=Schizaphis graminum TaxID=13262 RepID=A0A2S2P557_SCHGA